MSFSHVAIAAAFIGLISLPAIAAENLLQSGPMLGSSEMREVQLWLQTKKSADVKVIYWDIQSPAKRYETRTVKTNDQGAYTAHLTAERLEPGKRYQYEVMINQKKVDLKYPLQFQTQSLWQWRTDPPSFKMAIGSCFYVNDPAYDRPGKGYGGDYQIVSHINAQKPDLMLWLGDNTYLREADWFTRTGFVHRYTHTRSLPELQPLLASTHHYATFDDHDYGPNDSDRSFRDRGMSLNVFKDFWANPSYGTMEAPGSFTKFQWADVDVFMIDDRTYRTPNDRKTGPKTIIGEAQLQWLIDGLASSQAPFKIVAFGGQFINSVAKWENYATFPEERDRLLKAISDEQIPGVLFLSGDRHHSVLSKMPRTGTYPLYDLTVSPLTAGTASPGDEKNDFEVPNTLVVEHNFGMIEVSGPRKDRKLSMAIYDKDGKQRWIQEISAKELR